MIIAFWIMIGAIAVLALGMFLAGLLMDTGGERLIPLVYLASWVAAISGGVFVVLFGLHALGITINISHS
ncbi:hypothetical protein [Nocardia asiatica]|uniref:hypothetical protein n=1 Tax=Nocardia asiatica TaxID=209252 RepID=UPI002455A004|nr:hypothetical protein [Nocardia asiatica]